MSNVRAQKNQSALVPVGTMEIKTHSLEETKLNNEFQVSVVTDEASRNVAVLRIASAARNSITQFYPKRIQVSTPSLADLNRKLSEKLRLHRIPATQVSISLQFENDKTVAFNSIENLQRYDLKTDALTKLITLKWSFVFDAEGDGQEHLHSVYVRISEKPSPGLVLQKVLSGHSDDIDSLDEEAFSPVVCKIDFFDSRFSGEVLSVITEWVQALPKAEATFGLIGWLRKHEDRITWFVHGTLPALAVLGYVGLWLGVVPPYVSGSVRVASAWILGGGVVFLVTRYLAGVLNRTFVRQLQKISNVPVFQVTSGDSNRITKYVARSHKSMFKLAGVGLSYGAFKAIGLYLTTYIIRAFSQ